MRFQVDWNQIAFTITDQALSEGDQEGVDVVTSVFQILAQAGDLVADSEPQGERDRGLRGLTWTPWASSYTPSYRLHGVFSVPAYPRDPPG